MLVLGIVGLTSGLADEGWCLGWGLFAFCSECGVVCGMEEVDHLWVPMAY